MPQTIHTDRGAWVEDLRSVLLFVSQCVSQLQGLLWKDTLAAFRRPLYTLSQIIAPAVIIALLGYGASYTPKIAVPGYNYNSWEVVDTPAVNGDDGEAATRGLPSTLELAFTNQDPAILERDISDAQTVLKDAFGSAYFTDQFLPAYIDVSDDHRKTDPRMNAVNIPAAKPFLIPSLSSYLVQKDAMRKFVGRKGLKAYAATNDFIWHLFNKGKIVFTPSSDLVDRLVNFLLDSSDPILEEFINPYVGPSAFKTRQNFGFPSAAEVLDQDTWAVVSVREFTVDPTSRTMKLDYTILMNQTIVPTTDSVMERFPKGLGFKYADYLYSGYTVLQRAINNFAARETRKVASKTGMTPLVDAGKQMNIIELALSACTDKDSYEQAPDSQKQLVANLIAANGGNISKAVITPTDASTLLNGPCQYEIMLRCKAQLDSGDAKSILDCLEREEVGNRLSAICINAIRFYRLNKDGSNASANAEGVVVPGECFMASYLCGGGSSYNMTVLEFLTGIFNSYHGADFNNVKCFDMRAFSGGECASNGFATQHLEVVDKGADVCFDDVNKYCASYKDGASCWNSINGCGYGPLQCLENVAKDATKSLSPACAMLVKAVPLCADDLHSACPWDRKGKMGTFPSLCLHRNREYLSATCYQTPYRMFQLDRLYGMSVSYRNESRAEAFCKAGHDLEASFSQQRAIAAIAMAARPYTQQPFFEHVGPLVGLIVAIAFTVPFVATVRRVVEDRASYRRGYLLLIGVHHSVILFADAFLAFVHLIFAMLCALLALDNFLIESSRLMLFGILLSYSLALTTFATFVASLFNNPRTANSVAPMLLFLCAIPSYVSLMDLEWIAGFSPPAVAASCLNDVVRYSLSTAEKDYGYDISIYCAVMFGQSLLYGTLTMFVEYVRTMDFAYGCLFNALFACKRVCSQSSSVLFRSLMKGQLYQQVSGEDYTGAGGRWRRAVREEDLEEEDSAMENVNTQQQPRTRSGSVNVPSADPADIEFGDFNNASGSIPLTEEYTAETPNNNRTDYSIGGVSSRPNLDANTSPSTMTYEQQRAAAAAAGGGGGVAPEDIHQKRTGLNAISARFVELFNVSYATNRVHHGRSQTTSDVTCALYRNRVNVVIGPGGSGKTSLINVLTGQTAPTKGECLIDDREARLYDRANVGVCLQRDVTWDTLSVMEHLEFLQMVKSTWHEPGAAAAERISLCEALQLDASESLYADALPTGVLRRLSVAMAFTGGSKYIVLDEPTTCVDHMGRRCMWRLFNENAVGRCLVISTTNVEEAEAADHVLLLHRGMLRASGSPQFLKKHLGGGSMIVSVSRGQHCNASNIIDRVRAICPKTRLINNVGQELSFRVDPSDFHSVPDLVADLETAARENDIVSVSLADSRLDELFMVCVREYDATTGTAMPGSDGKFDDELSQSLAANDTVGDNNNSDDDDGRVRCTSSNNTTAAGDDDYVSQESAAVMTTTASSQNSSTAGGRGRAPSTTRPPGTSSRHVQASKVIPVDPSWFKTYGIVGSDRERKGRFDGFTLVNRNFNTVMIQRVNSLMAEVVGSALEFIIPLFAVMIAVGIMTMPVSDPPSLLLTPSIYEYNRVYFATPDRAYAASLNDKLFDGKMVPIPNRPFTRFGYTGDYRFANTSEGVTSVGMGISYTISYDNHDRANFFGGYAFQDAFALTRVTSPQTHAVIRQGARWPASVVFHNTSTPHSLPVFINVFDSLRIRRMANFETVQVLGRSDPFAAGETAKMATVREVLSLLGTILILVPFAFLPGIFALQVVSERQSGTLAAMTASKLSPFSYWLGTFCWHMIRYLFFAVTAIFAISYGGNRSVLNTSTATMECFGLFFLYGCCSIAMAYLISRCFKDAMGAQTFITLVNFVFGVVCVVSINAIDMMSDTTTNAEKKAVDAAKASDLTLEKRDLFRIIPIYALGEGLLKITTAEFFQSTDHADKFLSHKSLTSLFAVLGWTFPFYLAFLILFDGVFRITCIRAVTGFYGLVRDGFLIVFGPCISKSNTVGNNSGDPLAREPWDGDLRLHREGEDPSVTAERNKGPCPDGVSLREVWRKYTGFGAEHNVYAVRGATFSVAPGDRLAIVGSNGSGKSTLISIMGGVLATSKGSVDIKMRSLQKSTVEHWWARSFTGFSGDNVERAVPAFATPYMLFNLMADYRGMLADEVREGHVAHLLHTLGLLPYYNTPLAVLSASQKRRVGVGMAIVAFPPVIFLDEPTSGMDPVGRRMTWAALNLIPSKCALVLSTHRVDDVEMVANRVCLLQRGSVAFINDAHVAKQNAHLKGVIVQIHLNIKLAGAGGIGSSSAPTPTAGLMDSASAPSGNNDLYWVKNDVVEYILRTFPGSTLLEDRNNVDLKFHLCVDDDSERFFRPNSGAGSTSAAGTFGRNRTPTPPPPTSPPPHIGEDLLVGPEDENARAAAAEGARQQQQQVQRETEAPATATTPAPMLQPFSSLLSAAVRGGVSSVRADASSPSSAISIKHVFEKLHQKRVELMLQGVYGAPVSAPTSPSTDRRRAKTHTVVMGGEEAARERSAEARHRQEVIDVLGGPDSSYSRMAGSSLGSPSPATAVNANSTASSVRASSSSPAANNTTTTDDAVGNHNADSSAAPTAQQQQQRIMPFDIVITKSTIDQVLDKILGDKGETAALERMFQNTSARIPLRDGLH